MTLLISFDYPRGAVRDHAPGQSEVANFCGVQHLDAKDFVTDQFFFLTDLTLRCCWNGLAAIRNGSHLLRLARRGRRSRLAGMFSLVNRTLRAAKPSRSSSVATGLSQLKTHPANIKLYASGLRVNNFFHRFRARPIPVTVASQNRKSLLFSVANHPRNTKPGILLPKIIFHPWPRTLSLPSTERTAEKSCTP